MTLELLIDNWIAANSGPDEVRQTSAPLRIILGDRVATRVADNWSKSIRDEVYLSAYPLALWFASSWWRLRWESAPHKTATPGVPWRMAHEMAAAGCGFLWPRLTFESDGERIDVTCRSTNMTSIEPIGYLEDFRTSITTLEFERAIDAFVDLVLARLEIVGIRNTELGAIWNEVRAERADTEASRYRRLEAMLGYEPDEVQEEILSSLEALSNEAGEAAIAEIAPICSGDDPATALKNVIAWAHSRGIEGRIQQSGELTASINGTDALRSAPWERGWRLARLARANWGIDTDCVADDTLSDLMEIPTHTFRSSAMEYTREPIGLAIRNGTQDRLKILFRKHNYVGRRFEATRFLGDFLAAPTTDHWLPATDAKTARQKAQRAFAAEFLCPIGALQEFLKGDFSDEALEDAGAHFEVSPLTVRSHLANNHMLSWSQ